MTTPRLPTEPCAVAFKEWAGVCAALASGTQSLILRKGGILEKPGGFAPEHPVFWLYPTHVHEAEQGLRQTPPPARAAPQPAAVVALQFLAVVGPIGFVERLETLERLRDLHVWTTETVAKRFHYRKPGLWVLGVRIYRRAEPFWVDVTTEHAGCKTWVMLDAPLEDAGVVPVLDDDEDARRMDRIRSVLTSDR